LVGFGSRNGGLQSPQWLDLSGRHLSAVRVPIDPYSTGSTNADGD
jgi:hypothetical protein